MEHRIKELFNGSGKKSSLFLQPVMLTALKRLIILAFRIYRNILLKSKLRLFTGHCKLGHHMNSIDLVQEADTEDNKTVENILCP